MITRVHFHLPVRNPDASIASTWLGVLIGAYIVLFSLFLLYIMVSLNHYFFIPVFNNALFFSSLLFLVGS